MHHGSVPRTATPLSLPPQHRCPTIRSNELGSVQASAPPRAETETAQRGPRKTGTRVARGLGYQAVSHAARPARLRVFSLSLMRLSQTHRIIMRHVPCNAIPPTCQLPVSEKSAFTLCKSSTRNGKDPRSQASGGLDAVNTDSTTACAWWWARSSRRTWAFTGAYARNGFGTPWWMPMPPPTPLIGSELPAAAMMPRPSFASSTPKRRPSALFPTATVFAAGYPHCPRRQLWISRNRAKLPSMPMHRSKNKPATKATGRGLPWY